MSYSSRKSLYQKIEVHRQRPLIVYATSTRVGASGKMAGDMVAEFIDQIHKIDKKSAGVDILIHSNGGDGLVAWKLMATLREYFDNIAVLVPYSAMSAATLFCLGADEIYMHRNASLGPIDPQITILLPDGSQRNFAYEDVSALLHFMRQEVRITEQAHSVPIISQLFAAVDPISIGAAKRASELSSSIGERLLLTHMKDSSESSLAREIAQNLNKSFFAHGDTLSKKRAKELNLKVTATDELLEELLWEVYSEFETTMELRTRFDPVQIFLSSEIGQRFLVQVEPLLIPSNCPQELFVQAWQARVNQALSQSGANHNPVKFDLIMGLVESCRHSSTYYNRGRISAVSGPSGQVQCTVTTVSSDWEQTQE